MLPSMIWVAKNLYFFNCLLDGAHTIMRQPHLAYIFSKSIIPDQVWTEFVSLIARSLIDHRFRP